MTGKLYLNRMRKVVAGRQELRDSIKKPVTKDKPKSSDSVLPADFFALGVITTGVVDVGFVKAIVVAGKLGGQLRLNAEPISGQLKILNALPSKNFITGFHVGEVKVAQHIGEECEKPVGHVVPEQQDAMRAAGKARSVHDVGAPVEDGLDEFGIVGRVVFEISILDEKNVAGRVLETCADGGTFAAVNRVRVKLDVGGAGNTIEDFSRAIRGGVVDKNNLLGKIAGIGGADTADNFLDGVSFVEDWNQD